MPSLIHLETCFVAAYKMTKLRNNEMRLLTEAINVVEYENISRQQLKSLFIIPSALPSAPTPVHNTISTCRNTHSNLQKQEPLSKTVMIQRIYSKCSFFKGIFMSTAI